MLLAAPRGAGDSVPAAGQATRSAQALDTEPAAGMFLVARRSLQDPWFGRSIILLLKHDTSGSLGLIVNRRFHANLADAVPGIDSEEAEKHPLFFGGPVGSHQVFMLLRNPDSLPHTRHVTADIYFSADRHVLEEMLARKTPGSQLHLYLGYAGWTAGQLTAEIERGSWQLVESDAEAVFDDSIHQLWERLIDELEPLGIEVKLDSGRQEG